MKKFLAMLTLAAIFGGSMIGCTDADKDKAKKTDKVADKTIDKTVDKTVDKTTTTK